MSGGREHLRGRDAAQHAAFALFPLVMVIWLLHGELAKGISGIDFRDAYWIAGRHVLHGIGPYSYTRAQAAGGEAFVYPALAALLFAPFALLPVGVAGVLFVLLCIAAVVLTLRVLGVRDWRLYGLAVVWPPVIAGWQTANLTLLLGLILALAWRHRDRPVVAGVLAAVAISLKPFMWPLGLWLLVTRRLRACLWLVVSGLVINGAAWGVIGFHQISRYLHLSSEVTGALERTGYGLYDLALRFGATASTATGVEIALSVLVAGLCAWAGWRRREPAALSFAVVLMLCASPLLWNHYLALIIVPLAIAHPRVSLAWLVPLVLWVCPSDGVADWQALLFWAVTAGLTVALARAGGIRSERSRAVLAPGPRRRVLAP